MAGFTVSTDALHKHAKDIDNYMVQVESAVHQTDDMFDIYTFGVFNMVLIPLLNIWIGTAKKNIKSAVQLGQVLSDGLAKVQGKYDGADNSGRQSFGNLPGGNR